MFDDSGYQTLPNALDHSTIDALLERLQYYEANPDKYEAQLEFLYGPDRRVQKMRRLAWVDPEPWSRLWMAPSIQEFLQRQFDESVRIAYCAAFLKPPHGGVRIPCHQDQALWSRQLPGAFSCWFALDAADEENGCLVLCPGSHKKGQLPHDEPPGGGHPEVLASLLNQLPKQPVPLTSGSTVVWHRYTVHGSAANLSDRPRRGVVIVLAPSHLLSNGDPLAWTAPSDRDI